MNIKKPYGKGLSGFVLGLLLATAVIAGIVFFINKSNEKAFKEETPKELPKPEILTPKSSEPAASDVQTGSEPAVQVSEPAAASQEEAASAAETQEEASAVTVEQPEVREQEKTKTPVVVPPKPKKEVKPEQEAKKQVQKKPEAKQPEKEKKEAPKKAAKPSPEQILESGSIEKARETARAEAAKKAASEKAEARKGGSEGGRTVLQMGSFNNRESAEAHRAKLAMMGVSGSVVEAEANGKRVYRVQSGKMNKEAANRTQQTLKQNGVDSFARTVK